MLLSSCLSQEVSWDRSGHVHKKNPAPVLCWDRGIIFSCGATRLDAYRARLVRTFIRLPLITEGSPSPLLGKCLWVCPRKSIHIRARTTSQHRWLSETIPERYFSSSTVWQYHKPGLPRCQAAEMYFACISGTGKKHGTENVHRQEKMDSAGRRLAGACRERDGDAWYRVIPPVFLQFTEMLFSLHA